MSNEHRIMKVREHYEIYDTQGNFVVSGDTEHEALTELAYIIYNEHKAGAVA